MPPRDLLIVAGEVSGDMLAAGLVRALRQQDPALRFFGIGGDALRGEGMEILQDCASMAIVGFAEVLGRIPFFIRLLRRLEAVAAARRPAAAILVDYPGFNLRLAARLKRLGIPVFYYVCPQVWAWHRSRIGRLARSVERLFAIFPFEPEQLAGSGLPVEFVGHPLVDAVAALRLAPPPALPWSGAPRLALLPGSRPAEIDRHLPLLLDAARRLEREFPRLSCLLAAPTADAARALDARLAAHAGPRPARLAVVGGQTRALLGQADAAAVASGTATVETALMRCPMVILYRMATLSYAVAKRLVRVPHIGMVNLIAGRELCPELIQDALSADTLAAALRPLLAPTPERTRMLEGLDAVIAKLGKPGAETRTAAAIRAALDALPAHPPPREVPP